MTVMEGKKKVDELIINGIRFHERVLEYDLSDGVWTFKLDNGTIVVTTGSVMFIRESE